MKSLIAILGASYLTGTYSNLLGVTPCDTPEGETASTKAADLLNSVGNKAIPRLEVAVKASFDTFMAGGDTNPELGFAIQLVTQEEYEEVANGYDAIFAEAFPSATEEELLVYRVSAFQQGFTALKDQLTDVIDRTSEETICEDLVKQYGNTRTPGKGGGADALLAMALAGGLSDEHEADDEPGQDEQDDDGTEAGGDSIGLEAGITPGS